MASPPPMSRRQRKIVQSSGEPFSDSSPQQINVPSVFDNISLTEVTQNILLPQTESPLPPVFGGAAAAEPTSQTPEIPDYSAEPAPATNSPDILSRSVGEIPLTTSSLILPVTPQLDVSGPVGDTGEVILTGQLSIPNRLVETGTMPAMREDRDIETDLDPYVTGDIAPTSQPIRAVKAVSGDRNDAETILVRRVRRGKAAILTAMGAIFLGAGAIALIVIAFMTGALI